MSIVMAMWVAGAIGGATGAIDAHIRRRWVPQRSFVVPAIGGAVVGALGFGAFIVVGFVASLLTFSGSPDPGPALLCVILGCAAFLAARQFQPPVLAREGLQSGPRSASRPRTFADLLDARPQGGPATKWIGGVGLPLLMGYYGLRCIVTREGQIGSRLWPIVVDGVPAVALGVGWIGVGLFLYFHFFVGMSPGSETRSRKGKSLSLLVACLGFMPAVAGAVFSMVP